MGMTSSFVTQGTNQPALHSMVVVLGVQEAPAQIP